MSEYLLGPARVLRSGIYQGREQVAVVLAMLKTSFAVSPECQVVRVSYFRFAVPRVRDRVLQAFVQIVQLYFLSVLVMFITYKIE